MAILPKSAAPVAEPSTDGPTPPALTTEERKVRGQVRMHAIIAGYADASRLAPTLATSPASIKEELKKMAHEIAADIEEYSFR